MVHYTAPQAFVTGGVLREAGSQQELISLPRTFTPDSGSLDVELSPSLAGSLLSALEVLEAPDTALSAEATISYLLPNLEVYRALNGAGLSDPALSERVTANITAGTSRLLSLQNEDGGWNWWGKSVFLDDGTQDRKLAFVEHEEPFVQRTLVVLDEVSVFPQSCEDEVIEQRRAVHHLGEIARVLELLLERAGHIVESMMLPRESGFFTWWIIELREDTE